MLLVSFQNSVRFAMPPISLKPDVIVITETKLTPEKASQSDVHIPGYYDPIRKDRSACGGGVGVWIKDTLVFRHLDQINTGDHEVIWLALSLQCGEKVVICAAYRSGSCLDTDTELLQHINISIDTARSVSNRIILAGDFNVHNREWLGSTKTTPAGEYMEDLCHLHCLTQHVHEPTRGPNKLDLILSDFESVTVAVDQPLGRSDHSVIIADFLTQPHREPKSSRTVWRYHKADWARMNSFFATTDWETLITNDVNESCEAVTSQIVLGMKKFIPNKTLKTSKSSAPWWTPECSAAVNAKQAAWKKVRHNPQSAHLRQLHKESIKSSDQCLRLAKASHVRALRNRLTSRSLHSKQWWSTVKQATGSSKCSDIPLLIDPSGKEYATSKEKAECFAQHFSSKCNVKPILCGFGPFEHTQPLFTKLNIYPLSVRFNLKLYMLEPPWPM